MGGNTPIDTILNAIRSGSNIIIGRSKFSFHFGLQIILLVTIQNICCSSFCQLS